jgi:predicted nucleic acid-binding protein
VGGAIYDALIARCALNVGTDVLLTWNLRHFARLSAEIRQIVISPLEFKPGRIARRLSMD